MEAAKAGLSWLWTHWKKVGHFITSTLNYVLLIVAYFVAIGPVSLVLRISGNDVLDKRWAPEEAPESWWLPREPVSSERERYERQF